MCPIDTIVFVIDVPILAPIITWIACFTDITSLATKPTVKDVVVDEDWNNAVINIPITNPLIINLSKNYSICVMKYYWLL